MDWKAGDKVREGQITGKAKTGEKDLALARSSSGAARIDSNPESRSCLFWKVWGAWKGGCFLTQPLIRWRGGTSVSMPTCLSAYHTADTHHWLTVVIARTPAGQPSSPLPRAAERLCARFKPSENTQDTEVIRLSSREWPVLRGNRQLGSLIFFLKLICRIISAESHGTVYHISTTLVHLFIFSLIMWIN